MFAIRNRETGKYVTPAGSERSFCTNLQDARVYTNREAAQRDCCSNEVVLTLSEAMTHCPR